MKIITPEQVELIDAVLAELDVGLITASILEKDIHVTDALRGLMMLPLPGVELIFCGGTSLSKAYRLIERMSEDVDLKVVLTETPVLSGSAQKRLLSLLKSSVCETLTSLGFAESEDHRIARNENRYFCSRWRYEPQYPHDTSLRPYLSIELTVRRPQFQTHQRPLEYLVERLASWPSENPSIACVAVEETFAEKVISFLRRYAQHKAGAMQQEWDQTLVRHIYDIYCIDLADPLACSRAAAGFPRLVALDSAEFGRQYPRFAEHPADVMRTSLVEAWADPEIREQYESRLLPLIFGMIRPSFDEAYGVFRSRAEALIETC